MGLAISQRTFFANYKALKYAETTTVGWRFISMNGLAANINSPVIMMTEVVPSPTYSS